MFGRARRDGPNLSTEPALSTESSWRAAGRATAEGTPLCQRRPAGSAGRAPKRPARAGRWLFSAGAGFVLTGHLRRYVARRWRCARQPARERAGWPGRPADRGQHSHRQLACPASATKQARYPQVPNLVDTVMRTMTIGSAMASSAVSAQADLAIHPGTSSIGFLDWHVVAAAPPCPAHCAVWARVWALSRWSNPPGPCRGIPATVRSGYCGPSRRRR